MRVDAGYRWYKETKHWPGPTPASIQSKVNGMNKIVRTWRWLALAAGLDDTDALRALGLITSHGFYSGAYDRWFGEHQSAGTDRLRERRPDLHAWVTSTSWSGMDAKNVKEHHGNIHSAKVNGIIPWAGIQRPGKWTGGDPNPGCAFSVKDDGTWEVRRGYWFYKQVTRAG